MRQQNDFLAPSLNNSSMIQDMGFQWASSNYTNNNGDQLSYPYHQKFTEMMINHGSPSPSSSSNTQDFAIGYAKNEERELREMSEKLLLRSFSSGCQIKGLQFQAGNSSRGSSFSQILPTINISNLNRSNSNNSGIISSNSLDMNMQPLELFSTSDCSRFSAGCLSPAGSSDIHGFYKDNLYYGTVDHMQQSRPSISPSKVSTLFFFSPPRTNLIVLVTVLSPNYLHIQTLI